VKRSVPRSRTPRLGLSPSDGERMTNGVLRPMDSGVARPHESTLSLSRRLKIVAGSLAIFSRNLAYTTAGDVVATHVEDGTLDQHVNKQNAKRAMNIQRKWRECRLGIAGFAITMVLACPSFTATAGRVPAGATERDAEVNGGRMHHSIGGKCSPAIATLATTSPTLVGERLPSMVQFSMRH
jgi:hypothetical protein